MPRGRSRFEPLATSDRPRWLVVKDRHSAILNSTVILAGTDLHDVMADAIARRQADSWEAEGDGAYGFVFVRKAGVRCMVAVDPAEPVAGAYPPQPVPQPVRASL